MLLVAGSFVLCTLLLFGFVYGQTADYMTAKIDGEITQALRVIAADRTESRLEEIDDRLRHDPRRVKMVGLFGANGHVIAGSGNMESLPPGLAPDVPGNAVVVRVDDRGRETQKVLVVTHPLPGGDVPVIGRDIDEIDKIAKIVGRVLALGLLPRSGWRLSSECG